MAKDNKVGHKKEPKISALQPSDEQLIARAGLSLFTTCLRSIAPCSIIEPLFGPMRQNSKEQPIIELLVQVLSFFMDDTSRHPTPLGQLKVNQSYGALIGHERSASSHAIKRFLGSFSFCRVYLFRELLQGLFV